MKRLIPGAALAAALMMSATAYAAEDQSVGASGDAQGLSPSATMTATQPADATPAAATAATHVSPLVAKYSGECSTLSGQWTSASAEHSTAPKFHKAEGQAKLGATSCESHKVATLKSGVVHYRTALKLIGVKPTT